MIYLIDLFCGGGGTSTGASKAEGVKVIYCVNHDPMAIKSHEANHPDCIHAIEDIRTLDLSELINLVNSIKQNDSNAIIGLWASLECTNHSKAKGGLPRNADSRTLAFDLYRYLEQLPIDIVYIENVREFMIWGPLDKDCKPINDCSVYNQWVNGMKAFGYSFDWKLLNAADFGAFTKRIRYFAQFAKSNIETIWPEQTHSKKPTGNIKKWKAVRPCLQLENEGNSIFNRKKPLSDNTFKRILAGMHKFIPKGEKGFVAQYNSGSDNNRVSSFEDSINTVTTNNRFSIVQTHLSTYYKNFGLHSIDSPAPTVTTKDRISKIAVNFIDEQYGNGGSKSIDEPIGTLTTVPKFNIIKTEQMLFDLSWGGKLYSIDNPSITIIARQDKQPLYLLNLNSGPINVPVYDDDTEIVIEIKKFMLMYNISDIKMRMLFVEELLQIQGFPKYYKLFGTQANQKKFIGNAVEVNVAWAILEASAKGNLKSIAA
jgi:DNA (cytosine-5)-methyltransferase 1